AAGQPMLCQRLLDRCRDELPRGGIDGRLAWRNRQTLLGHQADADAALKNDAGFRLPGNTGADFRLIGHVGVIPGVLGYAGTTLAAREAARVQMKGYCLAS